MRRRGTALGAVGVIVSMALGCGSDSSSEVDASSVDDAAPSQDAVQADSGADIDAAPSCGLTWELVSTPISSIALMDPEPLNTERTVRLSVTTEIGGCEQRAMPALTRSDSNRELYIEMRAWRPLGADCTDPPQTLHRPVATRLTTAGTWSVRPGPPGTAGDTLQVEIGVAPGRPCANEIGYDCDMDCDCAYGEVCLGGHGFGGPFTECARPCELDRDCAGRGRCISIADGLELKCEESMPECDDTNFCPQGYSCADNACTPDFLLGAATRIACDCDADCDAPLRCIEASIPGRSRHCELACPTPSAAWCSTQHYCGPAMEDVAGTAPEDSVCVWAGE